jgi:nitroreductase
VETYLAIASRREVREYEDQPLPDDVVRRILDAGRMAGSSGNKQPWRFVLVSDREALAPAVYEPDNVRGAPLLVAIVLSGKGPLPFDAGRCVQSMLLAAWSEGVGGCPNFIADAEAAARVVGVGEEEKLQTVLSFGRPARPRNVESRTAEEWSARAKRKPLDELVTRR